MKSNGSTSDTTGLSVLKTACQKQPLCRSKRSPAAQDRLKQREAERSQTKAEIERLSLQRVTTVTEITPEALDIILAAWRAQFDRAEDSGNVRELKAWLMQFVSRIDLGYNRARIFYTYPINSMADLTPGGRLTESLSLGPLMQSAVRSIMVEWSQ
jgi:hypothetical protein